MKCRWAIILVPLLLCGCSVLPTKEEVESELEKKIQEDLEKTEHGDTDFATYQMYAESSELDESGYYYHEEMDDTEIDPDMIQVSFAKNSQLDILYYSDEAHEHQIPADQFLYLKQGSTIYASDPAHETASNADYAFSRFILYSFDDAGNRKQLSNGSDSDPLIIQLPSERTVHEISVVPIGAYRRRMLKLEDWYLDVDGSKKPMNGTWYLGERRITDNTFEIKAPESYSFFYRFDSDKYYVSNSTALEGGNTNGTIYFRNITVQQDVLSVLLKPFLQASVKSAQNDAVKQVTVDGKKQTADKNGCYELTKLKPGEKVVIRTDAAHKIVCDSLNADVLSKKKIEDGYDFSCVVPDSGKELRFESVPWGSKDISIDVDSRIVEHIPLISRLLNNPEDKLLKLRVGSEEYTYKELKTRRKITVNEEAELLLIVDSNLANQSNLAYEISVNGQNPVYVYKNNQTVPELTFANTETIQMTVKKGFVFSYQNLNNGGLDVEYRVIGMQSVLEENQFLPEGSEIAVTVKNTDQYTVTGGAVKAGLNSGTITVTDETRISDFTIQSKKKDKG